MMNFFKRVIYIVVNFGIVMIILGYLSWDELSLAISKMSISMAVLSLVMLIMVLIVYYRLKYWHVWTIVLILLALFCSGVEMPSGRLALTLAAVLFFWGLEKLAAKYFGDSDLLDQNEMVSLGLESTIDDKLGRNNK